MSKIIIKVKEEYLDLVPRPTKEERMTLKEDIKLHGQHDPIVINRDGFILDGYTRYEICQELGIEVKYRIQDFATKEDEKRYVINCNARRRRLNSFQLVEAMYEMFIIEKTLANKRRGFHAKAKGSAGEIIGKNIGLNRKTVEQAVYLMQHAPLITIKKLRNKEIGIDKAYNILRKPSYIRKFGQIYIKNDTKLICPHCQQISKKKQWKIA